MRKLAVLSLALCLTLTSAFIGFAGDGTEGNPYTIAEAIALSTGATEYWAQGYIVGGRYDDFDSPWTGDYGLSCHDTDSESDVSNCLQVKLEGDGSRVGWGLSTNPDNYQKMIKFQGFRDSYGGYASFEGIDFADISESGGASNVPPTLASVGNKSVVWSNTLNFSVSASDSVDSDDIVLSATDLPSGATFATVTNAATVNSTFNWADAGPLGVYTTTFWAADADGTNSETITITVGDGSGPSYIAFQGFESSGSDTWTIDAGNYIVSDTGSADTPDSERVRTGSYSWQPGQTEELSETLDLGSVDISSYSDVKATVHISATADSDGLPFGMWASDTLSISLDVDGAGFPATADVTVQGNDIAAGGITGALWRYSAAGVSVTTAGTAKTAAPVAGGVASDGIATVEVYVPAGATSVALRAVSALEYIGYYWNVDDIMLEGINDGGASDMPPSLSIDPSGTSKSVFVTNELSFVMTGTEIPNDATDTMELWATNLPSGASYTLASGTSPLTNTFSWTPSIAQTGTYVVSFFAGDKDGTNSTDVTILVREPGTGEYYAVICGISDYDGTANDLDYCDDDAEDVYDTLLQSPNWDASNMQLLLDSQATEAGIQSAITTMGNNAGPDSTCLFFFSGHGGDDEVDSDGDEGGDGYDEYLCPWAISSTEVTDDELGTWLDGLPTDNIIVWLDTCHSGGHLKGAEDGLTAKGYSRPVKEGVAKKGDGRVSRGSNGFADDLAAKISAKDSDDLTSPYIQTAADDDEYSYEDGSLEHGVYTIYLLEALTNADTDVSGWVSGQEAFTYLYPKVVAFESTQHPQEYDAYVGPADVVRSDADGNVAVITITTPASTTLMVPNTTATYDIAGTASTGTVGTMYWTNALTGGGGSFAAAATWNVNGIALGEGANVITVSGVDSEAESGSDSVTITRQQAGVLLFEDFDDDTSLPAGWSDVGTANDSLSTHLASTPNCRGIGSGDTLTSPAVDYPTNLSFYGDASSAGNGETVTVEYYDGTWNTLGTFSADSGGATESFATDSTPDLTATAGVQFRWSGPSSGTFYLDDVSVLGVGVVISNPPSVTITNPASGSVPNATTTVDVQGTANTNVVGLMSWNNTLTGGSGTLAAALEWTISGIPLDVGANVITVTGTNVDGIANSDNITVTRQSLGGGDTLDISGYDLIQANSSQTYTFPADTEIESEGYVIVGRDADQAAFESFWGVTLGSDVVYLNSGGSMPSLNGAEVYTIQDETDALIEGPTGQAASSGNTVQRNNTTDDATLSGSWTVSAVASADPGSGASGDGTAGLVINEYADGSGTGNYIYEYVELYYDNTGSGPTDPDDDSDGIPNWFEEDHSAGVTNLDAMADNDGDGMNNLDEWTAYCDPEDSNDYFMVQSTSEGTGAGFVLSWASNTGRVYDILWTADMGSPFSELATDVPATPPMNSYTDAVHSASDGGSYFIKVDFQ